MKKFTEDYLIGLATGIVLHSELGEAIDPKTNYRFSIKTISNRDDYDQMMDTKFLVCEWNKPGEQKKHETSTDRGIQYFYEDTIIDDKYEIKINKIIMEKILIQIIEKELIPQLVAVKFEY